MADPWRTAMDDQLKAASDSAERIALWIGSQPDFTIEVGSSGPIHSCFDAWVDALLNREIRFCGHIITLATVLWGMLDVPGVIYCSSCHLEAARIHDQDNPHNCDACGKFIPDNIFHETMIRAGNLILHGNVCRKCHRA